MENNENLNATPNVTPQEPVIEKSATPAAGNAPVEAEPNAAFGLWLTNKSALDLRHTASWTKFLAILGIIGCAFMLIVGISMLLLSCYVSSCTYPVPSSVECVLLGGLYVVLSVVCFFPVLSLLSFSNKTKKAYDLRDNQSLSAAVGKLHFSVKFYGVMTIVLLALYLAVAFFAGISALMHPVGAGI